MNAAEYLRKDTAHVFIPLIILPPFSLVSKTLRTLLRYSVFNFSFISVYWIWSAFSIPGYLWPAPSINPFMTLPSGKTASNYVISPLFRTNVAHLSMPNSMPVSSLKIRTAWASDSKPFLFLVYNFKSSIKRRWFIFSLLLENWYALSDLHKITVNGIRHRETESSWTISCFYIHST